eukprot:756727-Hanusia_phi.AAC.1
MSLNSISRELTRYFLYPSAAHVVEHSGREDLDHIDQVSAAASSTKFRSLSFNFDRDDSQLHFSDCSAHGWAPRLHPRRVYDMVTFFQVSNKR